MKIPALAVAGLGTLAFAGLASADFVNVTVENLGDIGGGVNTWRVYANFDSPTDTLLAISGNDTVAPLVFTSLDGDALVNSSPLGGLIQEDIPFPISDAWDSWVTIGDTATQNTAFSPGFLGGDGLRSVINGTSFTQLDNGGYFDQNPGTPEQGGSILIAQFTVANFSYGGTADWQAAGAGVVNSEFFVTTGVPAPGALALLGLAGFAARRRRG